MKLNQINWKKFGRIIIFIDAANIIYSCKDLGWKIAYKRLQKYFQQNADLVDIYFYSGREPDNAKQEGFLAMLSRKGFKLRVKQVKTRRDKTQKSDVDVDLAVDMLLLTEQYDTAVLMSGDGDYQAAVDAVQAKGKRVIVISTRDHIARELIESADLFLWLDNFRNYLELVLNHKTSPK